MNMAYFAPAYLVIMLSMVSGVLGDQPDSPAAKILGAGLFLGFVWIIWLCVWLNLPTRLQDYLRRPLRPKQDAENDSR